MSDELVKCPLCGFPLYQGNVKREKRDGKRTRRIHRVCPTGGIVTKKEYEEMHAHAETASSVCAKRQTEQKERLAVKYSKDMEAALTPAAFVEAVAGIVESEESIFDDHQSVADRVFRQQGMPYRFFIRKGDIDRIRTAARKGVSLRVEVYSAHEEMYEASPEWFEEFEENL